MTLFGTRSPAIAFRAAPGAGVIYPTTPPFSTVNERARHPDPNSLTDLADLGCDLRVCTGSLAAARKAHSRARHFGTTFTFLVQFFSACGAQHIICMQCFFSEVGSAAASVQACVTRVLASNALRRPRAPSSSASGRQVATVAERCTLHGAVHCKAVSAIAALSSPLPLSAALMPRQPLALYSTVHCLGCAALCMDRVRARDFCMNL